MRESQWRWGTSTKRRGKKRARSVAGRVAGVGPAARYPTRLRTRLATLPRAKRWTPLSAPQVKVRAVQSNHRRAARPNLSMAMAQINPRTIYPYVGVMTVWLKQPLTGEELKLVKSQ